MKKYRFIREEDVEKRLHTALNQQDLTTIGYFAQFGEDVRRQIINAAMYEQYRLCGYNEAPRYDDAGWCCNGSSVDLESRAEVLHIYNRNYNWYARAYILQHPNGSWVYGFDYFFGVGGGCNRPHSYSPWYDTRKEVITLALDSLQSQLTDIASRLKESVKVSAAIQQAREQLMPHYVQLTLF